MDVSIIIVNYNTKDLTLQCLSSIYEKTMDISFEVILVDNASVDGTCDAIRERYPQVIVLEQTENLGFGRANNLGAEIAKGKYLFFLNSDTVLLNNACKYFFDFFEKNQGQDIEAAGTILMDKDLSPVHSSGNFPTGKNILKDIICSYFVSDYFRKKASKERLDFRGESYFDVDYITGADLFMPRESFKKLNGFDRDFFMYYEDTDLQKRMNKRRVIISGPQIIHLEGKSNEWDTYSAKRRIMVTRSMFLYFNKHNRSLNYLFFRTFYFIVRLPVIVDKRISFKNRVDYLRLLMCNI